MVSVGVEVLGTNGYIKSLLIYLFICMKAKEGDHFVLSQYPGKLFPLHAC